MISIDSCRTDVRDTMIQSLSAFCFYSGSLRALENMRGNNRTVLIRALLTPYPNRSWAMTNLILVRFWKGCGFGFRYSHVYPSKFLQSLRKDRVQGRKNQCGRVFFLYIRFHDFDWSVQSLLHRSNINKKSDDTCRSTSMRRWCFSAVYWGNSTGLSQSSWAS